MARNSRAIPEINAGSMADIAFLLLIFFLVTTTMDVDSGINRKLPPWDPEQIQDPPPIKKKNIFTVLVNANDRLLVEDEYMDIKDLRAATVRFLDNNGDGSCQYCQGARNPESSDNPGKAIVSLVNDRGTSYKLYIAVQNELAAAYNELREREAQRKFGISYDNLSEDQQNEVQDMYPQKISEAEPVNLGG
ncbi:MAG TPA: biopolymer transporter ExbD [Cryomorphaceae bacterium]|nr:biopolymer transporter ExbD [Owenweeksia sp.]HAD96895.1 biopolymer transporter ExbD [Cryomorphaceae bacterium]|tara:strand:- start:266 stop:838 length:573 start_codon:yes stop_codon:yes gene_type:complete